MTECPIFLSARLKSKRLVSKALLDVLPGCSMTTFLAKRLSAVVGSSVVLTTSYLPTDDLLCSHIADSGFEVFRGHPDDKIQRYWDASQAKSAAWAIIVDGDDPLVSIEACKLLCDMALGDRELAADVYFFSGLPLGCSPWLLRTSILKDALSKKSEIDTEFWVQYVEQSGGKIAVLDSPFSFEFPSDLRLTVDYKEDLELIRALVDKSGFGISMKDIHDLLKDNPLLREINGKFR